MMYQQTQEGKLKLKKFEIDNMRYMATIYNENGDDEDTPVVDRATMESLLHGKHSYKVWNFQTQRECTGSFRI